MYRVELPDQNQINNLWLTLFTQGLIPGVNNPYAQALVVESAQPHTECGLISRPYQTSEQHNHNPFCAYDDSCPARQSQDRQGGIFRSVNYASIRPHQGLKGVEGAINSGQHVPQPLVPSYAPSGGAHFISGANAPLGTPAVPATMAVAEQTGNGGSPKRNDHLGLQAAGALPLSNGLLHLWRSPTSSTEADGAAYGNSSYVFSPLIYPWATPFDVSASRPAVQAVATQMNNVTPYPSYDNGGGETSLGTAVCAAISAPRPTRNVTGIACSTAPIPGRSDAGSCHRSCHRAICYDQTHRQVPTRRATQPSRSRATRGPEVQFEADVNALATRLLKEGADNTAVELLRTQVFNNDVSAKALTVKSIYIEQSTGASSTRSKYRLLLADVEMKDGSNGHGCLLCPQGRRKPYKNPQDAIRHLHKAHFGFAALCIGGCGRRYYRRSEMNQHLKKYCQGQVNIDARGAPAGPSASDI